MLELTRGPIVHGPLDRPRLAPVRHGAWGVLVAAVVGAALPQAWFRPGVFIATGSTAPQVLGVRGITRLWSGLVTGTGSTWFPSSELLPRSVTSLVRTLGGSAPLAQRLWFTLVVSACAASVAWCVHALVRRPGAVAAAGVAAVLDPFHLTTLPDLGPMIALAVLAMMVGVAARLTLGRHVPVAAAMVIAIWTAPLAEDPARLLVVAVFGVALVATVVARGRPGPAVAMSGMFVAGSLFWSVPLAVHLITDTPGLRAAASTNSGASSWMRAHSGLRNVLTHVASWVWGNADQLGSTARLARMPWSLLRWALPLLLLLCIGFTWHRRVTRVLSAVTVVAVLCCWQGHRLPGGWLFHQPMATFGPVAVFTCALLIGVGVDDGLDRWEQRGSEFDATQSLPVLAAMALATLIFVHPLIIGTVVPGARAYLPSARVALPSSFADAGRTLDTLPGSGSVLVLPLPDRVDRGTTWGYYGVDDLVGRFTGRSALSLLPGAYYEASGASTDLMRNAETALAHGDHDAFIGAMRALGASYLVVRSDVTTAYGIGHDFTDGRSLVTAGRRLGLRVVRSYDQLVLFSVPDAEAYTVAARTVEVGAAEGTTDELSTALAAPLLGEGVTIADRPLTVSGGKGVAWAPRADETGFATTVAAGDYRVGVVPLGPALWRASVNGRSVLLQPADRADVNGRSLLVRTGRTITAERTPFALLVRGPSDEAGAGDVVPLDGDTVVQAQAGATVMVLTADAAPLHFDGAKVGDCGAAGLPADPTPGMLATATVDGVDLTARTGTACVAMPVVQPDSLAGHRRWRFTASYDGSAPGALHVCLWLASTGRCAQASAVAAGGRSGAIDGVIDAFGDGLQGARLVLSVDHVGIDGDPSTTVHLSEVRLSPIVADGVPVPFPSAASAPVHVRVDVADNGLSLSAGNSLANMLGRFDLPGDDCNRYDDIPAHVVATSLTGEAAPAFGLSADRHTACVSAPVSVSPGIRDLTANFSYRSERSGVARVALVDTATGRAVATDRLAANTFWTDHQFRFTLPPGGAQTYQLYFYADGPGPGADRRRSHAEFRSVRLSPSRSFAIAAVPDPTSSAGATIRDLSRGFVAVHADGDAVLVQRQAYASGWQLDGLPAGVTAQRFIADGWANGWVIHGLNGRSVVLRTRYRDDPAGMIAVWSLPLVLLLALACTDWSRLRSNRVRA